MSCRSLCDGIRHEEKDLRNISQLASQCHKYIKTYLKLLGLTYYLYLYATQQSGSSSLSVIFYSCQEAGPAERSILGLIAKTLCLSMLTFETHPPILWTQPRSQAPFACRKSQRAWYTLSVHAPNFQKSGLQSGTCIAFGKKYYTCWLHAQTLRSKDKTCTAKPCHGE